MTGTVLVTGAAGRLGSRVVAHLHETGVQVRATDVVERTEVDGVPLEQVDLLDHEAVGALMDGVEAVVHLGNHAGLGPWPPQPVFAQNVTMNGNVFQAAAEHGVRRIVFASTLQLLGTHVDRRTVTSLPPTPPYPLDHTTPAQPTNLYALSKQVAELMLTYYVERCGIDAVAVRFPLLHNGGPRPAVHAGEETDIDILEAFSGLHVDDAAEAVGAILATELPGYRVYLLGTSDLHVDRPLPELIRAYYPGVDERLPDLVDCSALTDDTGWRPRRPYGGDQARRPA